VHQRVDDAPVGVQVALLDRIRAPAAGEQLLDEGMIEVAVLGMADLLQQGIDVRDGKREILAQAAQRRPGTLSYRQLSS